MCVCVCVYLERERKRDRLFKKGQKVSEIEFLLLFTAWIIKIYSPVVALCCSFQETKQYVRHCDGSQLCGFPMGLVMERSTFHFHSVDLYKNI